MGGFIAGIFPAIDLEQALGEDAAGTGVERRMSRWTSELVALKKTTGS